ncbi:hypothetical protein IKN40_03960 [bacterium]|nr:hypothetical protein [bacterium]
MILNKDWSNLDNTNMKDAIDQLYNESDFPVLDDTNNELESPTLILNLDEINANAQSEATEITERLSNYYFDERYIHEHPYITNKIQQEINNIRRLLKMLSVNEAAQDALIGNITSNAGKGSLYQSLTALQNTTLSIQSQLNKVTNEVENIFKEMQDNCQKTFEEKDKEEDTDTNKMIVRGSREFINSLIQKGLNKVKQEEKESSQQLDLFAS